MKISDFRSGISSYFSFRLIIFLVLFVAACSSGNDQTVSSYTVGGEVSGLTGSEFVLQNNGGDDLSVSADGAFTFATKINNDAAYNVTVSTQPSGHTCVVSNANGTVEGANVTNVTVECHKSGSLDTSFNSTGTVPGIATTAIGTTHDEAYGVAVLPDGKIVAAGYAYDGSQNDFALARYNADGSLDTTFGTGGIVTTIIGTGDKAISVAVLPNGKIVAAGQSYNGSNYVFALARYNTDGSLDTTFGTGGMVTTAIGTSSAYADSVAVQSDGKIVAAGDAYNGSAFVFAVARYNTDGSLDTSFDSDGIVTTSIGTQSDGVLSVAIQSDGKIVAAGESHNGTNYDFALARYNADGSLDTSFGTGGKVTTAIGTGTNYANSVAIQPDGKIVAAGESYNGTNYDFAFARYNADGSLDTSFGTGGKVTTAIGTSHDCAFGVAIQSDGRIVAAGSSWNGSDYDSALARYNADGSLDTTFGTGGMVINAIGTGTDAHRSVAIQSDGRIVAAGYSWNGTDYDFTLARYWP